MTEQRSRARSIQCPKCHSSETVRTGAYNVDTRRSTANSGTDESLVTIVYDRRCGGCGHIFMEVVETDQIS